MFRKIPELLLFITLDESMSPEDPEVPVEDVEPDPEVEGPDRPEGPRVCSRVS